MSNRNKFKAWSKTYSKWMFFTITDLLAAPHEVAEADIELNSLSQCTGVVDCEGADIYDNDICEQTDPDGNKKIIKIEWNKGMYAINNVFDSYDYSSIDMATEVGFRFEVIGNIHENPKLLNGS